jgi:FkbM family methyltransferase
MSLLGSVVRGTFLRLTGGTLRAELADVRRQLEKLRHRLERSAEESADLRKRLAANRRYTQAIKPDEKVLEQVLPLRLAAIVASNHDGRAEREAAFVARSDSYRDALAAFPEPGARIPDPVIVDGLAWHVPHTGGDAGGIVKHLAHDGRLPLQEILDARELAVGRVMIDVGANVGTTSIPRVVLGDFRCVYAAEPDPANYDCLVRNVISNRMRGLVLPDRVAIGDADGEMTMRVQASGTHHLVTAGSEVGDHERITVPCLTLDTWIDRMGIDVSDVAFIKSDTQGWDACVLAGATKVLARKHIAWQLEFSPAMLQRSGYTLEQFYGLMQRHFTHFIDLRGDDGARSRPVSEIHDALAYVERRTRRYTNVLMYSAV